MRAKARSKNPAPQEDVKLMEDGEVGLLCQVAEVIVRSQGIEDVKIQLLQMEELIVRAKEQSKSIALEEVVKLMEVGEVGHIGLIVEVIVRYQDPEVAIIQLLQMEDLIVRAKLRRKNPAPKEDVKLMEDGEVGQVGQVVKVIVRRQGTDHTCISMVISVSSLDLEFATIHLLLMVGMTVKEKTKIKGNALIVGENGLPLLIKDGAAGLNIKVIRMVSHQDL